MAMGFFLQKVISKFKLMALAILSIKLSDKGIYITRIQPQPNRRYSFDVLGPQRKEQLCRRRRLRMHFEKETQNELEITPDSAHQIFCAYCKTRQLDYVINFNETNRTQRTMRMRSLASFAKAIIASNSA